MIRRWGARSALTGVLTALLLGGCGLPQDGQARPLEDSSVPYGLLAPADSGGTTSSQQLQLQAAQPRIYLLDAAAALQPAPAPVDTSREVTPAGELAALFALLAAGPTERQRAAGLSTALAPDVRIDLVQVQGGIADLQLQASPREPSADRLPLAIGQLVLTATTVDGVDGVRIVRDGVPVEVPLPGGALTAGPLRRSDYRELVRPAGATPSPATASPATSDPPASAP